MLSLSSGRLWSDLHRKKIAFKQSAMENVAGSHAAGCYTRTTLIVESEKISRGCEQDLQYNSGDEGF